MEKAQAVASMGQVELLLPVWVKAALAANDRLKLYLTLLQAAAGAARHAQRAAPDLSREMAAAGLNEAWLRDLPGRASCLGQQFHIPDLPRLAKALAEDLAVMARPVLESVGPDNALQQRAQHWQAWLAAPAGRATGQRPTRPGAGLHGGAQAHRAPQV
jgi:hypothetical protein